jgi:hypothetical protein
MGESVYPTKKQARARKIQARDECIEQILALTEQKLNVKRITDYQYRVDNWIDLYPTSNTYHLLKANKRGSIDKSMPLSIFIANMSLAYEH